MVLGLLLSVLLSFGVSLAQNPPVLLLVVRGLDGTVWKMTCDEVTCSPWVQFFGILAYQPTVTWDEAKQEWVVVGIAPDNTIWMATFDKQGNFNDNWSQLPGASPSPLGLSGSYYGGVPIGAVIDWWRPNPSWAIPSGFAICDGSTVNDAGSPLNGVVLPNLTSLFIVGVTNVNNIGITGGSSAHSHIVDINHDHPSVNSSSSGSYTGNTVSVPDHNHRWAWGYNGDWQSWRSSGAGELMIVWGDGFGNEGSGIYAIGSTSGDSGQWYTEKDGGHYHQFSVPSHFHSVDIPALGTSNKTTTTVSNVPPYYGLLKLMRIR
jgi:hypothetical protein